MKGHPSLLCQWTYFTEYIITVYISQVINIFDNGTRRVAQSGMPQFKVLRNVINRKTTFEKEFLNFPFSSWLKESE